MKRLLLLLFLIPTILYSQKIKKDNFGYYNYVQPRFSIAFDDAEFYLLAVEISDNDAYKRTLFEEELGILRFKKAGAEDTPDFTFKIVEAPYKFGLSEKKSYTQKESDGSSTTMYYYTGSMSYNYSLIILDADDKEVFRDVVRGSETTKGRASASIREAHSYFVKDKLNFKEVAVRNSAEKLGEIFNSQFVNLDKTIHVRGVNVQGKKFEYPGFNKAYIDLEAAYEALNVKETVDTETRKLLDDCVNFWSEFLEGATTDDKKSRINEDVTAAAHYDLALAYFFLENFSEAHKHFEKAKGYDKGIVAGIYNWVNVSKDCAERLANH